LAIGLLLIVIAELHIRYAGFRIVIGFIIVHVEVILDLE